MHLFLYKASRHEKPKSYYGTRRLVQGTYRNDFDLDLIKGGIKGRYTILPHGSNAFQARLRDFGLEEEFYGHIIEVPEAKNAIWFKLNYDNIGKPGTNYQGSWRNLDVNELTQYDEPYKEGIKRLSFLNQEFQQVKYQYSQTERFLTNRNGFSDHLAEAREEGRVFMDALNDAAKHIQAEISQVQKELTAIREKIKFYMNTQKF